MNGQKMPSHAVSGLFVFLLLGLFAVFATVLALLGVRAYTAAAARTGVHSDARICTAYLRTMLRSEDKAGAISLETVTGQLPEDGGEAEVDVLALRENYDGDAYVTYLYVWNGSLREWFTDADEPFRPAEGEKICPADALTAELDGSLLSVEIQSGETRSTVQLALRTGGAA